MSMRSPRFCGQGVIFPRGEGASMTTWPMLPTPTRLHKAAPPTSDVSSSTPATVVKAPEGIVVEVSLMINAREPVQYRGVYTRFREAPPTPRVAAGKMEPHPSRGTTIRDVSGRADEYWPGPKGSPRRSSSRRATLTTITRTQAILPRRQG